jgi:hypothetical protein
LTSAEIQVNDQLNSIGHDDKNLLHRLLQANSFKGDKVSTGENGLKPSSETRDIVKAHVEDILKGGKYIQLASETSSTGGNNEMLRLMHKRSKKAKAMVSTKGKK